MEKKKSEIYTYLREFSLFYNTNWIKSSKRMRNTHIHTYPSWVIISKIAFPCIYGGRKIYQAKLGIYDKFSHCHFTNPWIWGLITSSSDTICSCQVEFFLKENPLAWTFKITKINLSLLNFLILVSKYVLLVHFLKWCNPDVKTESHYNPNGMWPIILITNFYTSPIHLISLNEYVTILFNQWYELI